MPSHKKISAGITAAFAVILIFLSGCTPAVYSHSIKHQYDANGQLIGIEETETITQREPQGSQLKVKITQKDKLEK